MLTIDFLLNQVAVDALAVRLEAKSSRPEALHSTSSHLDGDEMLIP